jgi:hypothetical protein
MAYKQAVKTARASEDRGFNVIERPARYTKHKFTEFIDDDTIPNEMEKEIAFKTASDLAANIILSLANSIKYKMKNNSGTEISVQIYLPLYEKDIEPKENKTFNIVINGTEYNFTWMDVLINHDTTDKYNRSPLIVELNKKFMKENNNELFIIDKSLANFENNASDNKEQFLMKHYFYIYLMTREGSSRYNVYTDTDNVRQFINKIDCLARATGEPEHVLPKQILSKPIALPPPSITKSASLIPKFEDVTDKYEIIHNIGTILVTMTPTQIYHFKLTLLSAYEPSFELEDISRKYENIYYITTILATMSIAQVYHYKSTLLSNSTTVKHESPKFSFTESSEKTEKKKYQTYLSVLKSSEQEEKDIAETSLDI